MRSRRPARLRASTSPVLPPIATRPLLMPSNESMAVNSVARSSWARIEAKVQGPKLLSRDRHPLLHHQLRDRLADVSIIVNDLTDGEPRPQEVAAVSAGALVDLLMIDRAAHSGATQGVHELGQEHGNPVRDSLVARPRRGSRCHARPRAGDDGVAVGGDELV